MTDNAEAPRPRPRGLDANNDEIDFEAGDMTRSIGWFNKV